MSKWLYKLIFVVFMKIMLERQKEVANVEILIVGRWMTDERFSYTVSR